MTHHRRHIAMRSFNMTIEHSIESFRVKWSYIMCQSPPFSSWIHNIMIIDRCCHWVWYLVTYTFTDTYPQIISIYHYWVHMPVLFCLLHQIPYYVHWCYEFFSVQVTIAMMNKLEHCIRKYETLNNVERKSVQTI